jgi:hypothetical protein
MIFFILRSVSFEDFIAQMKLKLHRQADETLHNNPDEDINKPVTENSKFEDEPNKSESRVQRINPRLPKSI